MLEKLRPDQDLQCYYERPSAIAALSATSPAGFTVSGCWRQQFDWFVLDWCRDNVFEHPLFRNLPDGDLSGLTLVYDEERQNVLPADSEIYPTVDWKFLRLWTCVAGAETMHRVPLKPLAQPVAGSYSCASLTLTLSGTITAGDYVGFGLLDSHATHQCYASDTLESVLDALVAATNAGPWAVASRSGTSLQVTFVGQTNGVKNTVANSEVGANGNRYGVYTYTSAGSGLSWNVTQANFAGGTSPTRWRYTIPFGSLRNEFGALVSTSDVRRLRWTFAADWQDGAFTRAEFALKVSNWTVSGANRAYQVAGPASVRYEDHEPQVSFSGAWTRGRGNFSGGTISSTSANGASVSLTYRASASHRLLVGTRLGENCGPVEYRVDGQLVRNESLHVPAEDVLVRRSLGTWPAGQHTVQIKHTGTQAQYLYFDFFEVAYPTTQLPTLPVEPKLTLATDWDTDHSLALSPERTARMIHDLGFHGRHNYYVGALEFSELYRKGHQYASKTVNFVGSPVFSAITSLNLEVEGVVTQFQHLNLIADTPERIATAFALDINRGYTSVRAVANGATLTLYARAMGEAGNALKLTASPAAGPFHVDVEGATANFTGGVNGVWTTDLAVSPRVNRACRDWSRSFCLAMQGYGIDVVTAFSTEIKYGDDSLAAGIAQRFFNGEPKWVNTPALQTNFSPESQAYWREVYLDAARWMADAGLQPYLQFGEVQWWYFADPGKGMPFYDTYTKDQFQARFGHPLPQVMSEHDNPADFPGAATFLASLIGEYTDAIMAHVRLTYPNARFEVLYPTDVNEGAFVAVANYPLAAWTPAKLDNLKTESFLYTGDRRLDKSLERSIQFGFSLGFTHQRRSHLVGLIEPFSAWLKEARLAEAITSDSVVLFALDQFCLIGYAAPLSDGLRRAIAS
jgi:hypothetical protein